MEIFSPEDNYEEVWQRTKAFYLRIGHPFSPEVGGEVAFNSIGFRHLVLKKGVLRPKKEQRERFALLVHAENILKDPNAKAIRQKRDKVDYWVFTEERDNKLIKLVVRQFLHGRKHFLTIYRSKKKPLM